MIRGRGGTGGPGDGETGRRTHTARRDRHPSRARHTLKSSHFLYNSTLIWIFIIYKIEKQTTAADQKHQERSESGYSVAGSLSAKGRGFPFYPED